MSQFYTDFSEYETGVAPGDWTNRFVTSNVTRTVEEVGGTIGGKVLRSVVTTATARRAVSWDAVEATALTEVLAKLRLSAKVDNVVNTGVAGRGSGAASSESAYVAFLARSMASNDRRTLHKYNAGAFSEIGGTNVAWSTNTWYWLRLRCDANAILAKFWADGDTEPAWLYVIPDTDLSSGWVGLLNATVGTHECDVFAVGTDGDPAVLPVPFDATISGSDTQAEGARVFAANQDTGIVYGPAIVDENGGYSLRVHSGSLYHVFAEYEDETPQKYNALSKWDVAPVDDE